MAVVVKGRRTRYDNIAVGSAISSKERVIAGAAQETVTDSVGNIENIAVGSDYGEERIVSAAALPEGERLGA
jgi:hypothetical protein